MQIIHMQQYSYAYHTINRPEIYDKYSQSSSVLLTFLCWTSLLVSNSKTLYSMQKYIWRTRIYVFNSKIASAVNKQYCHQNCTFLQDMGLDLPGCDLVENWLPDNMVSHTVVDQIKSQPASKLTVQFTYGCSLSNLSVNAANDRKCITWSINAY